MQKITGFAIRGKHTAIQGAITPFHVNVGSRERVRASASLLNGCRLLEGGRVEMVFGIYEHSGKDGRILPVPVLVYETQMGMGAADIIVREVLHHSCIEPVYRFEGREIATKGMVVDIRAGTSGGCNTDEKGGQPPVLQIGDIVVSDRVLGTSGPILQSIGVMPLLKLQDDADFRAALAQACNRWFSLGGELTSEGYLSMKTDPAVSREAWGAAWENGLVCHTGSVFSKESLYSEANHGFFVGLRKKENVLATEMEGLQLAYIAAEARAKGISMAVGVVAGIVGVVPGTGFPENKRQEGLARKAELDVLRVALGAMGRIAESLQR